MLHRTLFIGYLIAAIAVNGGDHQCSPYRFRRIVVFGDSLSDTGNVYALTDRTFPIVPPYYLGRFCNGPIWVDHLKNRTIHNYAYGSATTDNTLVQGYTKRGTVPVPGVRQQVAMYKNDQLKHDRGILHQTLFIFWAGGNDFVFNNRLQPEQIADSLIKSVIDLLGVGAKHFLMVNQAPIQLFPSFRRANLDALFKNLTDRGNNRLRENLEQLKRNHSQASFHIFNIHDLILELISNQSTVKFENTTAACWDMRNVTHVDINCPHPEKYVFIDGFHFTSTVHRVIAEFVRPFLSRHYKNKRSSPFIQTIV